MMKSLVSLVSSFFLFLCILNSLAFGAVYWDNDTGNQQWEVLANWSGDAGPTASPAIDIGTPNGLDECIIASGVTADEPSTLWIAYNTGTEGALSIEGGDLTCNGFFEIGWRGTGTCTLKSGSITTELYDVRLAGSDNGNATLNVQGGTVTAQRFFCPPLDSTGQGTLNMTGGSIVVVDYDFGKGSGSTVIAGVFDWWSK